MKEIENKFQATFNEWRLSADGYKVHYTEPFYNSEGKGKTFGSSVFVEDEVLINKVKELQPNTSITITTITYLSETEQKTVLVDFSCHKTKTTPSARQMPAIIASMRMS